LNCGIIGDETLPSLRSRFMKAVTGIQVLSREMRQF
jgi:hypothetical protein